MSRILTESHGPVGVLRLNRPERAHAYDRALLDTFEAAAVELAASHRVIVVASTGDRAFCAGADLDAMQTASPLDALELRSQLVFTRFARLGVVTIAAVHGAAVAGGFELAMACDLRVAGPHARFWLPETKLGIIPSAGGTTRLTRLVGPSRAKEVILGGRVLDAKAALEWGIAHRIADDPRADAMAWAAEVATRDPVALGFAKGLIDAGESDGALARERQAEAVLYARKRSAT